VCAIDTLLAVAEVSAQIAHAISASIGAGAVAGSQLVNNAGWAIGQRCATPAKHVRGVPEHRPPRRSEVAAAGQEDRRARGRCRQAAAFPFEASDIDQARAARVLIELDGCAPVITDLAAKLKPMAMESRRLQGRNSRAARVSGFRR
jgi:hypothetical protein